jgi:hypothetical protein
MLIFGLSRKNLKHIQDIEEGRGGNRGVQSMKLGFKSGFLLGRERNQQIWGSTEMEELNRNKGTRARRRWRCEREYKDLGFNRDGDIGLERRTLIRMEMEL